MSSIWSIRSFPRTAPGFGLRAPGRPKALGFRAGSLEALALPEPFFIPNERKKYSVGENAGMTLNASGGIEIYIAAKTPVGVPDENWLPIPRENIDLSPVMRIYVPDLERMKTWAAPKAEILR